jgi:predicted HTH transcriptional regulator
MPAIPSSDSSGHRGLSERANFAMSRLLEDTDIEFKRSEPWDTLKLGIVKSSLAMANLSRGGIIVVGVAQEQDAWRVKGIAASDLETFDPDIVLDQVNAFASPSIRLTLVRHFISDGTELLVLEVQPFESSPIVCKKNGPDGAGLTIGAIYIRPPGGKPESRPIRTAEELHDLLDRAAEIRSHNFLERADRLGMRAEDTDRQKFGEELGNL